MRGDAGLAASEPYRLVYEDMARRNPHFAFPNLLFAFKYIPMCVNGDEHRLARRRIAEFVAARKNIASAAAPRIVDRWVGKLAGSAQIELMDPGVAQANRITR